MSLAVIIVSAIAGLAMTGGLRLFVCELGYHKWKRFKYGKECCVCARRKWDEMGEIYE